MCRRASWVRPEALPSLPPGAPRSGQTAWSAALAVLLLAGCASLTPPQGREAGYPAGWPDMAPLDKQCTTLAGRYVNEGDLIGRQSAAIPVGLADLLLDKSAAHGDIVSLSVVSKSQWRDSENTSARLQVSVDDEESGGRMLETCFCIERALFCPDLHPGIAVGGPGLGLIAGQTNAWLMKAADGSLLVKLEHYLVGILVVAPLYSRSDTWARFVPAAQ